MNSTEEIDDQLKMNQPWAIAFLCSNFRSEEDRIACFAEVVQLRIRNADKTFNSFVDDQRTIITSMSRNFVFTVVNERCKHTKVQLLL